MFFKSFVHFSADDVLGEQNFVGVFDAFWENTFRLCNQSSFLFVDQSLKVILDNLVGVANLCDNKVKHNKKSKDDQEEPYDPEELLPALLHVAI